MRERPLESLESLDYFFSLCRSRYLWDYLQTSLGVQHTRYNALGRRIPMSESCGLFVMGRWYMVVKSFAKLFPFL